MPISRTLWTHTQRYIVQFVQSSSFDLWLNPHLCDHPPFIRWSHWYEYSAISHIQLNTVSRQQCCKCHEEHLVLLQMMSSVTCDVSSISEVCFYHWRVSLQDIKALVPLVLNISPLSHEMRVCVVMARSELNRISIEILCDMARKLQKHSDFPDTVMKLGYL